MPDQLFSVRSITAKPVLLMLVLALLSACANTQKAPSDVVQSIDGWQKIFPGGKTICSDGTAFHFLVRPGNSEKLLFSMAGGGSCATRRTCDPDKTPTYRRNTEGRPAPENGIFDFDDSRNPFRNYTAVYVPYCSGDLHLGTKDHLYEPIDEGDAPLTIHHRGWYNLESAMNWTYKNVPAPQKVFVNGTSAGAIPTPLVAGLMSDQYPQAKVGALGDGAGGYRFTKRGGAGVKNWGVFPNLNNIPGFEAFNPTQWNFEQIYIHAAKAHPAITFARIDAATDTAQLRFLGGRGANNSLLQNILQNNDDIRDEVVNFQSFILGGPLHTILGRPQFYAASAQGISLRDWVSDLALYKKVEDIECDTCEEMTLTE